jgi:hypothetical protein
VLWRGGWGGARGRGLYKLPCSISSSAPVMTLSGILFLRTWVKLVAAKHRPPVNPRLLSHNWVPHMSAIDVFLSYRNRPLRRSIVKRIATLLRNYEIKVWWDYGLEAGAEYEPQIFQKLKEAKVVLVLWCAESVRSQWVIREATQAGERLVMVRLQDVTPPSPFDTMQTVDLTNWEGLISAPRFQQLMASLRQVLQRNTDIATDTLEELESLKSLTPLPYKALSETGGPEIEDWIQEAHPVLIKFRLLYEEFEWKQFESQLSVKIFIQRLRGIVAELPPFPLPELRRSPSPIHRTRILDVLREHISDELTQGHPIPDSYRIEPIISELCVRPGIIVTCWSRREGFGELNTGMVVELELLNPN